MIDTRARDLFPAAQPQTGEELGCIPPAPRAFAHQLSYRHIVFAYDALQPSVARSLTQPGTWKSVATIGKSGPGKALQIHRSRHIDLTGGT